ncbi:general transcription factor 3C polypeptide 5, partial [Brachionus plicatilis]
MNGYESTSIKNFRTFVCVDYPGLVENESSAIKTLGGMERISQAFSRRNCNILLNFTPENIFSKSLCSHTIDDPNSLSESSFLEPPSEPDEAKTEYVKNSIISSSKQNDLVCMPCLVLSFKKLKKQKEPKMEIVGKVRRFYTFNKMADFQYLPMSSSTQRTTNEENQIINKFTYNAFYDTFLFNNIQNYDQELRKNQLNQLFILPPFFSRFDDPINYSYRSEPNKKQILEQVNESNKDLMGGADCGQKESVPKSDSLARLEENKGESNCLIRSMRQERSSQAFLVPFNSREVPDKPSEKLKPARTEQIRECITKLTELFQQRPCYLKSVLLCITNFSASLLKETLPYVAYYFTTGPWRSCWVKYGYDPRKHCGAKIYQMIDYRLRNTAEPEHIVKTKPRSSYHKRKFRGDLNESEMDEYKKFKPEEEMYKFKPD